MASSSMSDLVRAVAWYLRVVGKRNNCMVVIFDGGARSEKQIEEVSRGHVIR